MHDTILLNKISDNLNKICLQHGIEKVNKLLLVVNYNSHINDSNLLEYLKICSGALISGETEIKIERQDIPEQTAVLQIIEGDTSE